MVRYAWLAIALAGCDPTTFRDCEIACSAATGCPDGFACGTEGLCRAAGVTASCSQVLVDGGTDAPGVLTLHETADDTIAVGMSVACGDPTTFVTRDNTWYRAFSLADFGLAKPFHLAGVTFAVESSSQAVSLEVAVGSYTGIVGADTLDMSTFVLLDSGTAMIPVTSTGRLFSVPLHADIPVGGTFVVQIAAPDLKTTSGKFRVGSTVGAETSPGYIQSAACAISVPETTATAGKPNAHLIIAATGTE